jgi:hypothetical protein
MHERMMLVSLIHWPGAIYSPAASDTLLIFGVKRALMLGKRYVLEPFKIDLIGGYNQGDDLSQTLGAHF